MNKDMVAYVVRQGDYLAKLAFVHGFDADAVWNDPKNDEIRALRKDHNILSPGDVIYLPLQPKEGLPIQKGVVNRYVAKVPKVAVRLVLRDADGQPLAGEPYVVEGLGGPVQDETGPNGVVSLSASVLERELVIVLTNRGIRIPVHVGDLDPIAEMSGVRMRLVHLGYLEHAEQEDDDALRRALAAFQRARGIEVTGAADAATLDALREAHGP